MTFAIGCSHPAVKSDNFCGSDSFLLFSGKCVLSWSFYLSLLTVVLCMSVALFSSLVENSVQSVPCPCNSCSICLTEEVLMHFPTVDELKVFYDSYDPNSPIEESTFLTHNGMSSMERSHVKKFGLNDYEFVRAPSHLHSFDMRPLNHKSMSSSARTSHCQSTPQSTYSSSRL